MELIEKGTQVNTHNLLFASFIRAEGKLLNPGFRSIKREFDTGFLETRKIKKKLVKQGSDISNRL